MKSGFTATAGGRIALGARWHGLRGLAYGLQQPTMVGEVKLRGASEEDLSRVLGIAACFPGIQLQAPDDQRCLAERLLVMVADWVGAIQRLSGIPVAPGCFVQPLPSEDLNRDHQRFLLALPVHDADAQALVLPWVAAKLRQMDDPAFDLSDPQSAEVMKADAGALMARLQRFRESGLNRFHILQAAQRLDIPVQRLTARVHALGTGVHTRLLNSSITDATSSVGVSLAGSKSQTASLLRLAGLPGAQHLAAPSADEAVLAAERLGYPVVVKPDDQKRGLGVQANLVTPEQVITAWKAAKEVSDRLLVESWVDGNTHRLTVFNGRVIRLVQRLAGGVTGDGVNSVAALVELQAQEVRSGDLPGLRGARAVTLDEEALGLLQQAGLSPTHVPAPGTRIRLRRRDNINAGGRNVELPLSESHADNLALAVAAAAQLRLDFAGIDLISVNIAQSWLENGARICEVNPMPQLGVGGDPKIYEKLIPELMGGRYRVPVQVVLCRADAATRNQTVQACLRSHPADSVSDVSGLWHVGHRVAAAFESGFDAAQALMLRADVMRAVCVLSIEELVAQGFPVNRVDRLQLALGERLSTTEQSQVALARQMLPVVPSPNRAAGRDPSSVHGGLDLLLADEPD